MSVQVNCGVGAWAFKENGASRKSIYEVGIFVCTSSQETETMLARRQRICFWNQTAWFPTFFNMVGKVVAEASHPAHGFSPENLPRVKVSSRHVLIIACALLSCIQQCWLVQWKLLRVAGKGLALGAWAASSQGMRRQDGVGRVVQVS